VKSWLVIPALGAVCAGGAIGLGSPPLVALAAGLAGAALAAAIRGLAGDSPASLSGAVVAPLLALAALAEHGLVHASSCLAFAAACWTIVELARPTTSPLVAMLPATIAAILEPAAIALVPIAGWRLVIAPWQRPRWVIAVPIAGGVGVLLAVLAGTAHDGTLATLGTHWFGGPPHAVTPAHLAARIGHALGPLAAVAAAVGLAAVARLRLAALAALGCAIGTLLVDLRAGGVGAFTLGLAALCAGLAIGRFAATIRMVQLQAIAGATAGALVLVPPAWIAIEARIEQGPRVADAATSR